MKEGNTPRDPERECLSCEKFFTCPQMSAKKSGCIHFELDKNLVKEKKWWEQ